MNLVLSSSGQDANLIMNLEDLFARQRQTWATCPDWVQTMILKNIRETIKAKMEKEHGIQEDRREGFTDDWEAVAAKVQSQMSSRAPLQATPRIPTRPTPRIQTRPTSQIESQTPRNLHNGAPDNQNDSQKTVSSFNFSQASATRLFNFLDSDVQAPDGSQQVAGGLTLDNTVTLTTLRQLALSLNDLGPAGETTDLWDMEQEESGSINAGS